MRSKRTTYLLLAAVVGVWGVVMWKIFTPASRPACVPLAKPVSVQRERPDADTLLLDYADPFLKGAAKRVAPRSRSAVVTLPAPAAAREKAAIVHLGTVASKGLKLYILTINGEPYELRPGEAAAGFRFERCIGDSLCLRKNGITYRVKLCE